MPGRTVSAARTVGLTALVLIGVVSLLAVTFGLLVFIMAVLTGVL